MSNISHLGVAKKWLLLETLAGKVSNIGNKWLILETWKMAGQAG